MAFNVANALALPQWGQTAGQNIRANMREARAEEQRNMLAQALPAALGGDQNALATVAQADPNAYLTLQNSLYQRDQAATKAAQEAEEKRAGEYAQDLTGTLASVYSTPAEQRAAAWQQGLARLGTKYTPEELDDLTPEWSDQLGSELAAGLSLHSKESADVLSRFGALPQEPSKAPESPSSVREYEYAKNQGYPGSYQNFLLEQKRAGASSVTTYGSLTPGVDAQGRSVFVQPSNRGGAQVIPGVSPLPSTGAQPTQDERQSALLLARLRRAKQDIEGVLANNPGAERPEELGSFAGLMGETARNFANSSDRQMIESAQMDALDAALTLSTGAAYTKEQLEMQRRAHFPQIGDSKEAAAAKTARFAALVEDAELRSGRATPPLLKRPEGGSGGFKYLGAE